MQVAFMIIDVTLNYWIIEHIDKEDYAMSFIFWFLKGKKLFHIHSNLKVILLIYLIKFLRSLV